MGQSLGVQRAKLAGCDKLFEETRSGTTTHARPELKACLGWLREGDALVVTCLDRLALDAAPVPDRRRPPEKGVAFELPDQSIDTSDATGRLLLNMLGAIGQFETGLRAERQMDGIARDKARVVAFGRKKRLTPAQVEDLCRARANGALIRELMERHGIPRVSVYRYIGSTAPNTEP